MAQVCLVGSTGLVGSNILTTLAKSSKVNTLYAYSRRELPKSEKLRAITSTDTSLWSQQYPTGTELFISGLGTTRGQAGGVENQRKIDYDLNLELAKKAKEAGTKAYVLISSTGANSSAMVPYSKMKGELEDAVKALDFDHVVIVHPGLIGGERAAHDSRPPEYAVRKLAAVMGSISKKLTDFWAQDADVIAKAAVRAGLDCIEGVEKEKIRVLSQSDIVRLGRTEWKD